QHRRLPGEQEWTSRGRLPLYLAAGAAAPASGVGGTESGESARGLATGTLVLQALPGDSARGPEAWASALRQLSRRSLFQRLAAEEFCIGRQGVHGALRPAGLTHDLALRLCD